MAIDRFGRPNVVPDDPNLFDPDTGATNVGIGSATGGSTSVRTDDSGMGPVIKTPTTPTTPPVTGTTSTPIVSSPTTVPANSTGSSGPDPVAGFGPSGQYNPQNDSVVDALNRVTSSANPLMQRAAGIGAAVANSRGLQNSSIAAQSAQKAALDVAVPIASQEAQQANQKNLQFMQGLQQSQIANLQSDTQKHIATQQAAATSQAAFSQALLAASQSYSANVSAIMSNPDLKTASRQQALDAAARQRDADYTMMQKVYGVSLNSSALQWGA